MFPDTNPLISVVLLSYNRPHYLVQALESLYRQTYKNLEVIVVDNPSKASEDIAKLAKGFSGLKLVRPHQNLGYAAGMNLGLSQVTGEYVFLTEDDILTAPSCIENLFAYVSGSNTHGLVAPIIYNQEAKTIRCAGGQVQLGPIYRTEIFGWGEVDDGQFAEPFEVNYIDGATMFSRKDFWRQFKGFREEYFMYVDSVELCTRVANLGVPMTIVPAAKVYHFEPPADSPSPEIEFHKLKNFFSLYLLHAPTRILPEFICRYAILNGLRTLLHRTGYQRKTFFRALVWVARQTPSLLRERYAKS